MHGPGSASLAITRGDDGRMRFAIESVGGNGHICNVDGSLDGALGTAGEEDGAEACKIDFKVGASSIEVTSRSGDCRAYCGARAGFDGTYWLPAPGCSSDERGRQHQAFTALYRKKHYVQAYALLKKQFDRCSAFFSWIEVDDKRNDLALTAFHLGRPGECRDLLGKTLAADHPDLDALRNALPPTDLDAYQPIAESTWFNLKLCHGGAPAKGAKRG